MPKFPPRKGDLPREVLMAAASKAIAFHGGPERAEVYFKFTCEACGERCQFVEKNQLFESGECGRCGHNMPVQVGGYALLVREP